MQIEAHQLRRTFSSFERRRGLLGAVRDLFQTEGQERVAVEGLDLLVRPGEIVGFIGPNGAGKSTTIKMMTGVLAPSSGRLLVGGLEPHRQRQEHVRRIGVVYGQRTQLWWDLAVIEAFDLLAGIFEVPAADYRRRLALFDRELGIGPLLRQPVRELSLGQRMRCDLAAALIHGPPLVFLDEPTIGLDVEVKRRIRELVARLNRDEGTTILLTTHDLAEVEALCPRVVLIDQGRILIDGSIGELRQRLGGWRRLVVELEREVGPEQLGAALEGLPVSPTVTGGRVELRFRRAELSAAALIQTLSARLPVVDLSVEEEDIEEAVARFYQEQRP